MTKHPSYRARDQPESGSASQHRKDKIMHKFEKRDAKSRTLVILAVVGLAAALTVGIFTAVRLIRKPAASKDDPKTSIVYDSSAVEGGWDNLSPEEIAEKLNEKVAEGMINISMNTAPYFENGKAEGNVMIVNESINNYPQQVEFIRNDTGEQIYQSKAIPVGSKIERAALDVELPTGSYPSCMISSRLSMRISTKRSRSSTPEKRSSRSCWGCTPCAAVRTRNSSTVTQT